MKRRSLGQHYLVDEGVAGELVLRAELNGTERVLEIGTGRGVLTGLLCQSAATVEGYEIDKENFEETGRRITAKNLRLVNADVFKERPSFDVLVASLPYSRSADFVEWLSKADFDRAVVLLQEDFVSKLVSAPGERTYRGVSAIAQMSFAMEEGRRVGREAFVPRPKVASVITRFRHVKTMDGVLLEKIKALFALRRRTLKSASRSVGISLSMAPELGARRVYTLTPKELATIFFSNAFD
jgi:16S rRNA (adenine1518-N6/adenine1519-N6)-dimethyltransferase